MTRNALIRYATRKSLGARIATFLLMPIAVIGILSGALAYGATNAQDADAQFPHIPISPPLATPDTIDQTTTHLLDLVPAELRGPDGVSRTALAAAVTALPAPTSTPSAGEYKVEEFGQRWADVDRNGCDTRNDILQRDLLDITIEPGTNDCKVTAGRLLDPYTGLTVVATNRQDLGDDIEIDHIVARSWAWQHGADAWTAEQRLAFANDPLNLLAVDGPTNGQKNDHGPADWTPQINQCEFAALFTAILTRYELAPGTDDRDALAAAAQSCPGA